MTQKESDERIPLPIGQRQQGVLYRKILIPVARHVPRLNSFQADNSTNQGLTGIKQAVFFGNLGVNRKFCGQGLEQLIRTAEHACRILEKHKRQPVLDQIQRKIKVCTRCVDTRCLLYTSRCV